MNCKQQDSAWSARKILDEVRLVLCLLAAQMKKMQKSAIELHLTASMQQAARTGLRFHLRNGRSTEYATPKTALPKSVTIKGNEPTSTPITSAVMPHRDTSVRANGIENSPDASGR